MVLNICSEKNDIFHDVTIDISTSVLYEVLQIVFFALERKNRRDLNQFGKS